MIVKTDIMTSNNSRSVRRFAKKLTASAAAGALAWVSTVFAAGVAPAYAQSTGSTNYVRITEINAATPKIVRLGLDKSVVIDLPADAHDILVANPSVADAVTRTSRRLYVFGKEIGQTNIFIFDGEGKQIAALDFLIERDISGLEDTIHRLIPNSSVRAEMINDNLVLTGTVGTPKAAAEVLRLANIFITGGEQTNTRSGGGLFSFFNNQESQIVNLLKIQGEDQVHLKVVIAEIQRSVVKQLGLNTSVNSDVSNGFAFSAVGRGAPGLHTIPLMTNATASLTDPIGSLTATYNALERNGVMRTLAEPSLTAISGEEAHFRVGGTYNIPSSVESGDDGGVNVTFERLEYGVALTFRPTVLTEGRISLKIRTEVSEPTSKGVPTFRSDVPLVSIRERIADTTVELPSGGSMVIAGLIQDDVRQTISGKPGFKDIPIFGSLFRSREFVRDESEVVVLVTPYLVRPTARQNLIQPDENFHAASDSAGQFMGRINRVYGTKQGNLPKGRYKGTIGFIYK